MRGRRRLAVLLLAVAGVIPACAAQTADGPSAATSSPEPASPSLVPSASASVDPTAICDEVAQGGPTLEIHVTAASFAFDVDEIEGPIHCEPFVIVFTNSDVPTPDMDTRHNINIRAGNVLGPLLFEGDIIGHGEIRYEVPGLPAGEHYFYCSIHAGAMSGSIIVAPAS